MNILFIDTSDNQKIKVGLQIEDKTYWVSSKARILKSQVVLPLIDKIIKQQGLKIENIDSINVATGPGSFTGLRVGVAIANALSFSLSKPVNGKRIFEIDLPLY